MKNIGLIGGLSWHSSLQMYEYINRYIADRLGEYNCAVMTMVNVNLQDIFVNRPDEQHLILADAARSLEKAGADFIIICSNTMHRHYDYISSQVSVPVLHIASATADAILDAGIERIGLMGTAITMKENFYSSVLEDRGIQVLIPDDDQIEFIEDVLYNETGFGIVKESSSAEFYRIAESLVDRGAQGIILGCTEIGMLMQQEHTSIPLFDTTIIHGETAAAISLDDEKFTKTFKGA